MPRGIYPRTNLSEAQKKMMRENLAKGRERKARDKARKTNKKYHEDPEWAKKISRKTKEALWFPEVRQRYLNSMESFHGYQYSNFNSIVPLTAACIDKETINRFWSRVEVKGDNDCWPFLGGGNAKGYGHFWSGSRGVHSNRFVLVLKLNRELQENEQALHHCDNPVCCNPSHIFLGNNDANVKDKIKKGRQPQGENTGRAVLNTNQVKEIRALYAAGKSSYRKLAKQFGVNGSTIKAIVKKISWKYV